MTGNNAEYMDAFYTKEIELQRKLSEQIPFTKVDIARLATNYMRLQRVILEERALKNLTAIYKLLVLAESMSDLFLVDGSGFSGYRRVGNSSSLEQDRWYMKSPVGISLAKDDEEIAAYVWPADSETLHVHGIEMHNNEPCGRSRKIELSDIFTRVERYAGLLGIGTITVERLDKILSGTNDGRYCDLSNRFKSSLNSKNYVERLDRKWIKYI